MPSMGWIGKKAVRVKELLLDYAYLITLGAVVAVIAASAMYTSRVKTQFEEQNGAPVEAAADAPEIGDLSPALPSAAPRPTPLPTIAPLVIGTLGTGMGRVWPVSGEIIRGHKPDELVLWETLSCYQTHPGVDIAGKAGEEILCVMDGVVEKVSRDLLWGYRVSVAQTDGSTAIYAGVAHCVLCEGDAITRGEVVGDLMSEVPCERELGAHLHLEYELEGKTADPNQLLRNAKRK